MIQLDIKFMKTSNKTWARKFKVKITRADMETEIQNKQDHIRGIEKQIRDIKLQLKS